VHVFSQLWILPSSSPAPPATAWRFAETSVRAGAGPGDATRMFSVLSGGSLNPPPRLLVQDKSGADWGWFSLWLNTYFRVGSDLLLGSLLDFSSINRFPTQAYLAPFLLSQESRGAIVLIRFKGFFLRPASARPSLSNSGKPPPATLVYYSFLPLLVKVLLNFVPMLAPDLCAPVSRNSGSASCFLWYLPGGDPFALLLGCLVGTEWHTIRLGLHIKFTFFSIDTWESAKKFESYLISSNNRFKLSYETHV